MVQRQATTAVGLAKVDRRAAKGSGHNGPVAGQKVGVRTLGKLRRFAETAVALVEIVFRTRCEFVILNEGAIVLAVGFLMSIGIVIRLGRKSQKSSS